MSAGKKKLTPRQRMINLMYVVLMAMLALNVSSDVLNGFTIVDSGLTRSTDNATKQNSAIFQDFEAQMLQNPEKVGEWYAKAKRVKELSDSAFNYAEELKVRMVREADGKNADVRNIKNKENLEAANYIMLSPVTGEGQKLYDLINNYRNQLKTQNIVDVNNKEYDYQTGVYYMDLIAECEKLGDYVVNVVEASSDMKEKKAP